MKWGKLIFRDFSWAMLALGIFTLLLRFSLIPFPKIVEQVYSRGLFLGIRWLLDHSFGYSPIPFSYILFVLLIAGLVFRWWKRRKNPKGAWKSRLLLAGKQLVGILGLLIFLFNFMWGFNYGRIPIEQHLGMQLDSLSLEELCFEADWIARRAEAARAAIPNSNDDSLSHVADHSKLEQEVRRSVSKTMSHLGYPDVGRIRGRMIEPGGWMLRIGISGIYNPFTGEGNVSSAQTIEKWPFTMAHEMAHACGFGDEGTCNFVGMLACEESQDPYVQYSGRMGYWRHLASEIVPLDPDLYKMLRHNLSPGIQADLKASYNNSIKYSGSIAKIGLGVNNAYLKAQGINEGIKSYDRVVLMRAAWHQKTGE